MIIVVVYSNKCSKYKIRKLVLFIETATQKEPPYSVGDGVTQEENRGQIISSVAKAINHGTD